MFVSLTVLAYDGRDGGQHLAGDYRVCVVVPPSGKQGVEQFAVPREGGVVGVVVDDDQDAVHLAVAPLVLQVAHDFFVAVYDIAHLLGVVVLEQALLLLEVYVQVVLHVLYDGLPSGVAVDGAEDVDLAGSVFVDPHDEVHDQRARPPCARREKQRPERYGVGDRQPRLLHVELRRLDGFDLS